MRTILSALALASLAACASGNPQPSRRGSAGASDSAGPRVPTNATAHADLRDTEGRSLGTLTLLQTAHGVLITGDLTGLPAGVHAIHVHESGRCEAPFTSAGGHLNLGMRTHGIKSANGPHVGDLANFNAPASGAAHVEQVSRELTLIPGPIGVFDADGASLVVHAGADDYTSDPAGNSGNRIACGPIAR